jgi:hypothetical protein
MASVPGAQSHLSVCYFIWSFPPCSSASSRSGSSELSHPSPRSTDPSLARSKYSVHPEDPEKWGTASHGAGSGTAEANQGNCPLGREGQHPRAETGYASAIPEPRVNALRLAFEGERRWGIGEHEGTMTLFKYRRQDHRFAFDPPSSTCGDWCIACIALTECTSRLRSWPSSGSLPPRSRQGRHIDRRNPTSRRRPVS